MELLNYKTKNASYLITAPNGKWVFAVTGLGVEVPENGIPLYIITVPAGNSDTSDLYLDAVTLSSVRRMEANFPVFFNNSLYANVLFEHPMPDNEYIINLDVLDVAGSGFQKGDIYAGDRNINGFKIYYNGVVDNLKIRWEASKPEPTSLSA
jgi:hypothetical protein